MLGTAILTKSGAEKIGQSWLAGKRVEFQGVGGGLISSVTRKGTELAQELSYDGEDPSVLDVRLTDGTPLS